MLFPLQKALLRARSSWRSSRRISRGREGRLQGVPRPCDPPPRRDPGHALEDREGTDGRRALQRPRLPRGLGRLLARRPQELRHGRRARPEGLPALVQRRPRPGPSGRVVGRPVALPQGGEARPGQLVRRGGCSASRRRRSDTRDAAVDAYSRSLRVDTSLFDAGVNPFAVTTRLKARVLLETYERRRVDAAFPSRTSSRTRPGSRRSFSTQEGPEGTVEIEEPPRTGPVVTSVPPPAVDRPPVTLQPAGRPASTRRRRAYSGSAGSEGDGPIEVSPAPSREAPPAEGNRPSRRVAGSRVRDRERGPGDRGRLSDAFPRRVHAQGSESRPGKPHASSGRRVAARAAQPVFQRGTRSVGDPALPVPPRANFRSSPIPAIPRRKSESRPETVASDTLSVGPPLLHGVAGDDQPERVRRRGRPRASRGGPRRRGPGPRRRGGRAARLRAGDRRRSSSRRSGAERSRRSRTAFPDGARARRPAAATSVRRPNGSPRSTRRVRPWGVPSPSRTPRTSPPGAVGVVHERDQGRGEGVAPFPRPGGEERLLVVAEEERREAADEVRGDEGVEEDVGPRRLERPAVEGQEDPIGGVPGEARHRQLLGARGGADDAGREAPARRTGRRPSRRASRGGSPTSRRAPPSWRDAPPALRATPTLRGP